MNLNGTDTFRLPDGNDQTTQRPDIIPGVPLYIPGGVHYIPGGNGATTSLLNPAAFQAPPIDSNGNFTRFGNAPNGVARAINIWQVDFALTKETKLTERVGLQFAVQAFNIFNHVQLGDPSTGLDFDLGNQNGGTGNLSSGSFGSITSSVNGLGTIRVPVCRGNFNLWFASSSNLRNLSLQANFQTRRIRLPMRNESMLNGKLSLATVYTVVETVPRAKPWRSIRKRTSFSSPPLKMDG